MKRWLFIVLSFVCICLITPLSVQANEENDTVYPVTPGSKEWERLETVQDKLEACRISDSKLNEMSDAELIQAVIDYPFLVDIFLCDDYHSAVEKLSNNCDALRELLTRKNAKKELLNFLSIRYKTLDSEITGKEEYQNDALSIIIGFTPILRDALDDNEISFLNLHTDYYIIENSEKNSTRAAYVYTPNGTSVLCTTPSCNHSANDYHSSIDSDTASTYGVTLISGGSCRYNCHSYAWYASTSNSIWIDNPRAYMEDGSYSMVISGLSTNSISAANGDRVCYGSSAAALHSARLSSNASSTPLSNRMAQSKWGIAGVFQHSVANVPSIYWDNYSTISVWD